MTLSNREVVNRFVRGGTRGRANRMEIIEGKNGKTHLLGYGWAIYGTRTKTGKIILHNGWYGYSRTTSTHLNLLRPKADEIKDDSKPRFQDNF